MSLRSIPENTKSALDALNNISSHLLEEYGFYLAGGTALSLQIDHRISYDLDFFTEKEFDPGHFLNNFTNFKLENIETSSGTLKFNLNGCAISFFYYPYKVLGQFSTIENYNIKLASLIDIGLMKITALADRGLRKDFIDLYFISKNLKGLKEIIKFFSEKFPTGNYYHYLISLTYFDTAESDPQPNMLIDINWDEIKNYFISQSKELAS